jgi:hypothetical protein
MQGTESPAPANTRDGASTRDTSEDFGARVRQDVGAGAGGLMS